MNEAPRTRESRRLIRIGVGLAWLVVLAVAATTVLAARDYLLVDEARSPDLVGLPLAEAERSARRAGLELRSYPVPARGVAADVVVEQAPPAGTVVREGRVLSVGVHVPAEADRMPALVGVTEQDALASLRGLGLPSPDIDYVSSDRPTGRVVEQAPPAGRSVAPGDRVRLTVARGAAAAQVEIPDLTGLDVESARAQLTALGLRRIETVPVGVSMLRPGTVTQQRPAPGTVTRAGEPVLLGFALEGSRVTRVPAVEGLETWRARVALRSAGLELGALETVQRDDLPAGVVEARPSGLTVAGAPVTLVVNAPDGRTVDVGDLGGDGAGRDGIGRDGIGRDGIGRDGVATGADSPRVDGEGGRLVPFRFDPGQLGVATLIERDYELRLVVRDDRGERTVVDRQVAAGETVRTTVVVHGDEPLLQTYVNGVFFQAWRP